MTRTRSIRPRTRSRRLIIGAVGAGFVATALTGIQPAAAHPPQRSADQNAVRSGDARFEVLSPTLIRTEYAGNGAFLDAATFNAIGRDSFGRTHFTARTVGGWLTIDTGAVTLRYKVGSGAFNADNLQLTEANGSQRVTAAPWADAMKTCVLGTRCEAEDLALAGPGVATDHSGYTGRGFAAGFANTGDSMTFRTSVAQAGSYDFAARYANSTGGDGKNVTRTLSITVDGGAPVTLSLPTTANWDTWQVASTALTLPAGTHTVQVVRSASDSGNVNIDNVAIVPPGSAYPPVSPPVAQPCTFGSLCEADTGNLVGGARLAYDHNDYSGIGFVAGMEHAGAADTLTVTGVPRAGSYQLQLRYANYAAGAQPIQPRTVAISVGDAAPNPVTLSPTSSWDAWRTVSVPVQLAAGTDAITLGCPTDNSCNVNFDTVAVTDKRSGLLDPHAALGGYRRGLDGVDGGALSTPGLLYQDGWSLVDDTASAVFDPRTHQIAPRPSHAGVPYQDGYVFGYGKNYKQGLQDLATLTGPPALLPRWAYGLWYSEYYNRTAADYENTILPAFRAEGVPLDVLVTDTDFKTPNTWNGWEIDPSKFPDPAAYFAWAHSQGLHTSLNIHPSILASDPQFAQAQATAKGKLKPGGCGGGGNDCYVFDFGDPDQLRAYLQLHDSMKQAGNDVWWLDWCCDQSYSTLAGVTPDAWINQQYADYTATPGTRGFAFSRAYGSLQAGGYSSPTAVPTGPWADKRTTLHFTGDTTSDWATLQYEVGYTPGESAATGMASISHDIGGHTNGLQQPGSEPGSTKLPDDLYARWVQFGTFQPIDRLHSNHSDRLPWQYGAAARASADKFLNLREALLPYTYTLAHQASVTGTPIVQPLYLDYPQQQEAYANADSEYLYGPDVLVAPATTPGTTTTTSVWFPAGSSWTDYFTGKTYAGGTTAQITTDLSSMPVFLRSGGILTTRTNNVANDQQNPLDQVTVTVAEGANGSGSLYEDNGDTTDLAQSSTTTIKYDRHGRNHEVSIAGVRGHFAGQVQRRAWTVVFSNASAPTTVSIDGHKVSAASWSWDAATGSVTVHVPARPIRDRVVVSYR
ncbi:MAG TPA: TIM-barrel domain-containing protein [Jatrophihabitans sp.]|nr:TIM-barrel domain-containing protein [Jatrophihabitans sp.]